MQYFRTLVVLCVCTDKGNLLILQMGKKHRKLFMAENCNLVGLFQAGRFDAETLLRKSFEVEPKSLQQKERADTQPVTSWLLGVTAFQIFMFIQASVSCDKA